MQESASVTAVEKETEGLTKEEAAQAALEAHRRQPEHKWYHEPPHEGLTRVDTKKTRMATNNNSLFNYRTPKRKHKL